MNINIKRELLLPALQRANGVIEKRQSIPILSNVLFQCDAQQLTITATDTEVEVNTSMSLGTQEQAKVAIPARKLFDICKELPENSDIKIELSSKQAKIKSGRSRFILALSSGQEFPKIGDFDNLCEFKIEIGLLKNLIDKTEFAMALQDVRHYLNGLLLEVQDGLIRAVATDGHRLARVEVPLPEGAKEMPNIIIPRKAITEVRKLIDDWSDDIDISLSETKICFSIGDIILSTKLIDGTFPDYERVIPSGNDKNMRVNCNDLSEAVDRVSTISTEKSRAIKLHLSNNNLVLSANSPESGTAIEELEVNYNGEMIEIGFNSRYLLDIANQIEGENVEFSMADPGSPTILRDQEDTSALYVLMPMRV